MNRRTIPIGTRFRLWGFYLNEAGTRLVECVETRERVADRGSKIVVASSLTGVSWPATTAGARKAGRDTCDRNTEEGMRVSIEVLGRVVVA